jgi:hypothetical protein
MTSETRVTIELQDIKAIELECQKCHSRNVRPVEACFGSVTKCANCNELWMLPNAQDAENITAFINSLFACRTQTNSTQPYKIRLELTGSKVEATA